MADLTALPTRLLAGDSYTITLTYADYPASAGWALRYAVAGVDVKTWTSAADGDAHVLTLTAAETAGLIAGTYNYQLRAVLGDTAETVERGLLAIEADLAAVAPGASANYWEGLKRDAETALTALVAGGAVQMVTILGRQTMFRSPDDLLRLIARCDHEIAKARNNGRRGQLSFVASGPSPASVWS